MEPDELLLYAFLVAAVVAIALRLHPVKPATVPSVPPTVYPLLFNGQFLGTPPPTACIISANQPSLSQRSNRVVFTFSDVGNINSVQTVLVLSSAFSWPGTVFVSATDDLGLVNYSSVSIASNGVIITVASAWVGTLKVELELPSNNYDGSTFEGRICNYT